MKSVAFHNLGCKVNGYEMDFMQQMLQEKGYKIVPFDAIADIYIINTCTVTNIADRKSRQMLHRAKKQNPEAVVVAVGCYVQAGNEEVLKDLSIHFGGIPGRKGKDRGSRGENNGKDASRQNLDRYWKDQRVRRNEAEADGRAYQGVY